MSTSSARWFALAALLAALAVAAGAFGAHALPGALASRSLTPEVVAKRLHDFETAARYQMYAAVWIALVALLRDRCDHALLRAANWLTLVGCAIFCGVLYALTFAEPPYRAWLGMSAPFGGLALIAGGLAAAAGVLRGRR